MKQFDIKPFDPILCKVHLDDEWRPDVFICKDVNRGFEVSESKVCNYILKYTPDIECYNYIGSTRNDVGHWIYDCNRSRDKIHWTYASNDECLNHLIRMTTWPVAYLEEGEC